MVEWPGHCTHQALNDFETLAQVEGLHRTSRRPFEHGKHKPCLNLAQEIPKGGMGIMASTNVTVSWGAKRE